VELVCPAGGLPALKAAVDNGADWVCLGLRDDTNARNFPGLNFDAAALEAGLAYALGSDVSLSADAAMKAPLRPVSFPASEFVTNL
jgi:putative protease